MAAITMAAASLACLGSHLANRDARSEGGGGGQGNEETEESGGVDGEPGVGPGGGIDGGAEELGS